VNVFVARQPIFDRGNQVAGYELLYRNNGDAVHAAGLSSERMCTEMVANALLTIGLDRLTGGRPAFVNATREFMVEGLFRLFPPRAVVVELLETVEPDDHAIAACEQMVSEGYQLALDDFEYGPQFDPLLDIAHIVKLDVLGRELADVRRAAERVRPFSVQLVAERVETEEVHAACVGLGFDLFQGYFFSRPETLTARELPPSLSTAIRLLNLARDPRTTDRMLEDVVASDASLSYKLLRIASSATLGGRSAASLSSVVRALGRETLARLAGTLAISTSASEGGAETELVRISLVRARLCELIAEASGRGDDAGALFMVGLFSKIDALVKIPLADVVDRIAFPPAVCLALLENAGPYAPTLAVVDAYERGAWGETESLVRGLGVAPERMGDLYAEALSWMRERMDALG
jgi:EAL and modified HD-GYP domain-containing signal transduction protein